MLDKQHIQLVRREFGMPSLEALAGEVDHGFRQHESAADAVCIYLLDAGAPVSEVEFGQLLKHFPRVLEAYRADRFDKFYPIVYNYRNYETNL